jgi:hypothetical protein
VLDEELRYGADGSILERHGRYEARLNAEADRQSLQEPSLAIKVQH